MKFDIEDITLGDLEDLEAEGISLGSLAQLSDGFDLEAGEFPPIKVLRALAWLVDREKYPSLDGARSARLGDLMELAASIETPTDAEGE